jgi:hypothetical protein
MAGPADGWLLGRATTLFHFAESRGVPRIAAAARPESVDD